MNRIILLFMLAGLVLGSAKATSAQDDEEVKQRVAYSWHDKAKNETTYEVRGIEAANTGDQTILINASVTVPGLKLVQRPDDVIFLVQVISSSLRYPDMLKMAVKADGKSMPDVLMLNMDKRPLDDKFLETLGTRMKYDIFKAIAHAKSVELQVDKTTILLSSGQLAILGDLDKMLNP